MLITLREKFYTKFSSFQLVMCCHKIGKAFYQSYKLVFLVTDKRRLVQHLDEEKILNSVKLEKDVDGFHPLNMGNLAMRGKEPLFISCTPKGCVELLIRSGVEIMGKNAVVIGRSNIVGLPTSLLLQVCCILIQNHLRYSSIFWLEVLTEAILSFCTMLGRGTMQQ